MNRESDKFFDFMYIFAVVSGTIVIGLYLSLMIIYALGSIWKALF